MKEDEHINHTIEISDDAFEILTDIAANMYVSNETVILMALVRLQRHLKYIGSAHEDYD